MGGLILTVGKVVAKYGSTSVCDRGRARPREGEINIHEIECSPATVPAGRWRTLLHEGRTGGRARARRRAKHCRALSDRSLIPRHTAERWAGAQRFLIR